MKRIAIIGAAALISDGNGGGDGSPNGFEDGDR